MRFPNDTTNKTIVDADKLLLADGSTGLPYHTTIGNVKEESRMSFFNVSLANNNATYADSTTARNAVPVAWRSVLQFITYKLNNGNTIFEQFIGTAVSGWATEANWSNVNIINSASRLGNNVVTPRATTFFNKITENYYDDTTSDIVVGYYLDTATGNPIAPNANYITTGYINISALVGSYLTANGDLALQPNGFFRFCCFYDQNKVKIGSVLENVQNALVPTGAVYFRASFAMTLISRSAYAIVNNETFIQPYLFDPKLLPSIPFTLLPNLTPYMPMQAKNISVTAGNYYELSPIKMGNHLWQIAASFDFTALNGGSITVGKGRTVYQGSNVKIDATNVTVYSGVGINETHPHGMLIGNKLQVYIRQEYMTTRIYLISDGGSYNFETVNFIGNDTPFIQTSGVNITANLSFNSETDLSKKILVIADSYGGATSLSRWVGVAYNTLDVTSFMTSNLSGGTSADGLLLLEDALKHGKGFKYVVWAMGMNDTVFATWQSQLTQAISMIEAYGATVILATIPSVPTRDKTQINNYIYSSNKRYVDFSRAVTDGTSEWFPGMLHSDGIHPTELGARALAQRFTTDLPEVLKGENTKKSDIEVTQSITSDTDTVPSNSAVNLSLSDRVTYDKIGMAKVVDIVRYPNGYINKSGVLVTTGTSVANFNYTGYLPANAEYTISNVYTSANVSAVAIFDSNNQFIQDYTPTSAVKFNPKTVNANAAYIRISLNILNYPSVTVTGQTIGVLDKVALSKIEKGDTFVFEQNGALFNNTGLASFLKIDLISLVFHENYYWNATNGVFTALATWLSTDKIPFTNGAIYIKGFTSISGYIMLFNQAGAFVTYIKPNITNPNQVYELLNTSNYGFVAFNVGKNTDGYTFAEMKALFKVSKSTNFSEKATLNGWNIPYENIIGGNSTITNWTALGTSITWQDGRAYVTTGEIARGYMTQVNELSKNSYIVTNEGRSGYAMAGATGSIMAVGVAINYANVGLVTIDSGTNDFKLNKSIGNIGSIFDADTAFDLDTYYGAFRKLLNHIITSNPNTRIVLLTPIHRNNAGYTTESTNTAGHKLSDYRDAILALSKMYSLQVIDLYTDCGINAKNLDIFTMDGLHPNDDGYTLMANSIHRQLQ